MTRNQWGATLFCVGAILLIYVFAAYTVIAWRHA